MDKNDLRAYYDLFRTNFLEFVRFFLKDHLVCEVADFHKEIYDLITKENRIALACPRGHAKSHIVSVFYPLWLSLFNKRKDIVIISASETLAVEWIRKIKRELEVNPKIRDFFGDLKSDKWTESHLILNNKSRVNIRARGSGGQIKGFRPDVIICDDIETPEEVVSEDQRKKLKEWLFKACIPALTPEGQFLIIGTIDHPLCVLSDLLVADNGWVKRKYRAYVDGVQEAGHELWGALWDHERLQKRKREIGTFAFASQYMNDPISDETAPIKENQIRYWKELPSQYSMVIAVDPAYSEDEQADFKVASLIAIDPKMDRYLVRYVRTHSPMGEFQDSIINLWLSYRGYITNVGVPNSGVEKSFFESFMKKCQQRNIYPPITELKNSFTSVVTQISARNKKARIISALQPLFENGKYYIHTDHVEARGELLEIGSSRWDDIVDTMAYAEQILTPVFYGAEGSTRRWDYETPNEDHGATGYGEDYN